MRRTKELILPRGRSIRARDTHLANSPDPAELFRVPAEKLPQTVREFLARYIHSVEQVEILLLVSGESNRSWSAAQVYDVILSSEASVARWLELLTGDGLLQHSPEDAATYCAVADAGVVAQIAALRQAYRTLPTRTIEAIYKREADPVQGFADAFKLKEPRPE